MVKLGKFSIPVKSLISLEYEVLVNEVASSPASRITHLESEIARTHPLDTQSERRVLSGISDSSASGSFWIMETSLVHEPFVLAIRIIPPRVIDALLRL